MPGLIGSLVLLIVGAIARYAYSDEVWTWTAGGERNSLQVDTIGSILLIAGLIGLLLSMAYGFMGRGRPIIEEKIVYKDDYKDDRADRRPRGRDTADVDRDSDAVPPVRTSSRGRQRKTLE